MINNGQEDATFETLMFRFNEKSKDVKILINSQLDFMFMIDENINTTKYEIKMISMEILDDFSRWNLLSKVKSRWHKTRPDVHDTLRDEIQTINDKKKTLKEICDQICSEIDLMLPIKSDKEFGISFKNWNSNPANVEHIKRVQSELSSMKQKYLVLHETFNVQMKPLLEIIATIGSETEGAHSLFEKIVAAYSPNKMLEDIEKLHPILKGIIDVYTLNADLPQKLLNVRNALQSYNEQRIKWAEFVIGMRQTPSGEKKRVKLTITAQAKKISKNVKGVLSCVGCQKD